MDKVQKIREEVARLMYGFNLEADIASCEDAETEKLANIKYQLCKKILDYIDKVQEGTVKIKKGYKYRCLSDMVNKDTGNISFVAGKIYLAPKDNTLVSEENGWLCDTSENASNFELVEEPVSEELIIELKSIVNIRELAHQGIPVVKIARHIANWQKEKDQETKETAIHHAYHNGRLEMKEQMMAKAIDGVITLDYYGEDDKEYGYVAHDSFCLEDFGLKDRDKVKVIVIKED